MAKLCAGPKETQGFVDSPPFHAASVRVMFSSCFLHPRWDLYVTPHAQTRFERKQSWPESVRLGKRVPEGLSGEQGRGLGCQEAGLGRSGLSLEGHGEQLVSRRGERLGHSATSWGQGRSPAEPHKGLSSGEQEKGERRRDASSI